MFGYVIGGFLIWEQPLAILLEDGTYLGVYFENLWLDGHGESNTVSATVVRFDASSVSVPEPGTIALFLLGLFCLWFAGRQQRHTTARL